MKTFRIFVCCHNCLQCPTALHRTTSCHTSFALRWLSNLLRAYLLIVRHLLLATCLDPSRSLSFPQPQSRHVSLQLLRHSSSHTSRIRCHLPLCVRSFHHLLQSPGDVCIFARTSLHSVNHLRCVYSAASWCVPHCC